LVAVGAVLAVAVGALVDVRVAVGGAGLLVWVALGATAEVAVGAADVAVGTAAVEVGTAAAVAVAVGRLSSESSSPQAVSVTSARTDNSCARRMSRCMAETPVRNDTS
jgi:hypothetical protein